MVVLEMGSRSMDRFETQPKAVICLERHLHRLSQPRGEARQEVHPLTP